MGAVGGWLVALSLLLVGGCTRRPAPAHDGVDAAPPLVSAPPRPDAAPGQALASPVNLAADVRNRVDAIRKELDAGAQVEIVGDAFVFVAPDGGRFFRQAVDLARKALPLLLQGRFDRGPDRGVTVYAFGSEESFADACDAREKGECKTAYGEYFPRGRVVLANLSRGVSTCLHEMVHAIVQTDDPSAPKWLSEGLGSLVESPRFDPPGEIHGVTNWRLPLLKQTMASAAQGSSVRVEALFSMSDQAFEQPETLLLHEAMARYLCQWLDERGLLWPFYRAWRDSAGQDVDGRATFTRVVGMTPEAATAPWRRWVQGLVFPPR